MKGYLNRLFGWGKQPSKETLHEGEVVLPLTKAQYSDLDVPLYNKRMELLKYLVENNAEDALGDEINALLTALLEQLQVKVFEPPDLLTDDNGPYARVRDGE